MKRTPLQRRTPLKAGKGLDRRTRLRAKPSRRARPDEPLEPWCQIAVKGVCTGYSQHRHHVQRRAAQGGDAATNTIDCCLPCHAFVHANPAISYAHGWLKRREYAA